MMTLDAGFKQVFGETLAENGFIKIKGRHPYYVRVVEGGEIIHIITYRKEVSGDPGKRAFDILGGIATVYRQRIDLDINPSSNIRWLVNNWWLYTHSNISDFDPEFRESIYDFTYIKDSEDSMLDSLKYSLELTEEFMVPIFNEVDSLDKCIKFLKKFKLPCSPASFNLGDYDEGFLNIEIDNNELKEKWRKILNKTVSVDESTYKWVEERAKFYNDPYMRGKALEELERRKTANTEILRSYGFNL